MRKNIKNIICILCLLMVMLMICGCVQTPPVISESSPKIEAEAWGNTITVSEDSESPEDSETEGEVSSEVDDDEFTPATIPTVSIETDKDSDETKKDEETFTKSDSGAFTYKSAALSGNNKKITGFKVLTEKPTAYEKLEFELNVPNLPEGLNVYKETDVDIEIEMVSSSGKKIFADAFYFEEYSFTETKQLGRRTSKEPVFRFRMSPQGGGTWDFTVTLKISGKEVDTLSGYVNVAKREKGSQVLKVEPVRKQVFMTKSGELMPLIGENIDQDDKDYGIKTLWGKQVVERTSKLDQFGGNYIRLWRGQDTGGNMLEGIYSYAQDSSAMWDYIFESIDDMEVYMSMVLMAHSEIRQDKPVDCAWHYSVWNKENGGFIDNAVDFFSDRNTTNAYKNYVRYVVSRWGYNEYVMCWELFNEMDHSDAVHDYRYDDISDWQDEIAAYIREIDAYGHMVGNSCGMADNVFATYKAYEFVYYHRYAAEATIEAIAELQKNSWLVEQRPALLGEAGSGGWGDLSGEYIEDNMLSLHQGNWAGVMGGGAGTAMNWYFHVMDRKDFYWSYQVVSEIAKLIPFDDPGMLMVNTSSASPSNERIGAMGYRGADYAYIWFYDEKLNAINPVEKTFKNETASVAIGNGTYNVSWVNTWTGVSISKEKATVTDGTLTFKIPEFTKDVVVTVTPAK